MRGCGFVWGRGEMRCGYAWVWVGVCRRWGAGTGVRGVVAVTVVRGVVAETVVGVWRGVGMGVWHGVGTGVRGK